MVALTYEQGIIHVSGYNIGLPHGARGSGPARLGAPLLDLRQFVDQEDPLALGARGGLHNPHRIRVASELLHE